MADRVGAMAAGVTLVLAAIYAAVTGIGLLSLPNPDAPIADPWFTLMELLILAMLPGLIALAAALAVSAPVERRVFGAIALAAMVATCSLTGAVHFSILALSHQPGFADWNAVFAFRWPSLVYALDILAWDGFFPFALAAMVPLFPRARPIQALLVVAAGLSLFGLSGVATGNMGLRTIGVAGYALVFPLACALMLPWFRRSPARA